MSTFTPFVEGAEGAASWLIETAWHASILAAIVGAAQILFRDRLAPRWRHAMWLLVALRLVLPDVPGCQWSPLRLLAWPGSIASSARPVPQSGASSLVLLAAPEGGARSRLAPASATDSDSGRAAAPRATPPRSWRFWLGLAWLAGSAVLLSRLAISVVALRRQARALSPVTDPAITELLEACAARMGVRSAPAVFTDRIGARHVPAAFADRIGVPRVAAPALLGWFRPRILLPGDLLARLSPADLRFVLFHELAHLKRQDVLVSWLLAVIQAIHWMNPLVWWAFTHAREEAELACDELAVARGGERDGREYGHAVLRLLAAVQDRPARAGMAAGVHGSRRFLSRRIRELSRLDLRARRATVLPVILLAGCAAAGLTGSPNGGARNTPTAGTAASGELVWRTYDVAPLLRASPDFAAPGLGIVIEPGAEEKARQEAESHAALEKARSRMIQELEAKIRSVAAPELWATGDRIVWGKDHTAVLAPTSVQEKVQGLFEKGEARVTLLAPVSVQEKVQGLLERLIAEHRLIVHLETRLVTLDGDLSETLPPPLAKRIEGALSKETSAEHPRLDREDVDRLVASANLQKLPVHMPSVTLFNHQLSFVLVVNQAAMIADAKVTVEGGQRKLEPIIGVLNTGFTVQVRPAVSEDKTRIELELVAQTAETKGPSKVAVVEGVPIEMPELSLHAIPASLDAPRGAWILAGGARRWEQVVLLLVKADLVEPAPEEK